MPAVKTITVRDDQSKWLGENYINLSHFVQAKIDEEIEKRKGKRKGKEGKKKGENGD